MHRKCTILYFYNTALEFHTLQNALLFYYSVGFWQWYSLPIVCMDVEHTVCFRDCVPEMY